MRFIYLSQDGTTTGPFTGQEVREAIATGMATSETPACTDGAKEWQPVGKMLATLAEVQAYANAKAAPLVVKPVDSGDHVFMLVLLLLCGVGVAGYFGLFFNTAREGVNNIGLLNDRLCGVIGGCSIMVVAAVLLVVQALWRILAELKNRK